MDIAKTIADHAAWLRNEPDGIRADLTRAILTNERK